MRLLSILLFASLAATGLAMAAETAPVAQPGLVEMGAYGIATMVVGAIAFVAHKLFGVTMDASHRATLHSAVRTGAALALSVGAEWLAKGRTPDEARLFGEQRALGYVHQAAGDALDHFKLNSNDAMLRAMLLAATVQIAPPQAPASAAAN